MPRILLVDDTPTNLKLLVERLRTEPSYQIETADCGEQALAMMQRGLPDLLVLDVVMPGISGYDVCRQVRREEGGQGLPIILMTALDSIEERVKGLDAGADDFLSRPVHWPELLARVRSLLRIKTLLDTVRSQSEQLEEMNRTLEERVERQVRHIERLNRLRRFLSPAVAEIVISSEDDLLQSHRREIAAICFDLRNFTAFSESVDAEDTVELLGAYHRTVGRTVVEHDGTIDHFAGDGIMAFVNDPVPCERPALRAVSLALAARDRVRALLERWNARGHSLGFGAGVSSGSATIGLVGFEGRYDYAATGRALNLAARLCDRATDGQVLVAPNVYDDVASEVETEDLGEITFKGFSRPMPVRNVLSLA